VLRTALRFYSRDTPAIDYRTRAHTRWTSNVVPSNRARRVSREVFLAVNAWNKYLSSCATRDIIRRGRLRARHRFRDRRRDIRLDTRASCEIAHTTARFSRPTRTGRHYHIALYRARLKRASRTWRRRDIRAICARGDFSTKNSALHFHRARSRINARRSVPVFIRIHLSPFAIIDGNDSYPR